MLTTMALPAMNKEHYSLIILEQKHFQDLLSDFLHFLDFDFLFPMQKKIEVNKIYFVASILSGLEKDANIRLCAHK